MLRTLASILCFVCALLGSASAADRSMAKALLAGVPALLANNDFAAAEDLCKRALQSDDTCPEAHFHLGTAYEKLNKLQSAVKEYLAASKYALEAKDPVFSAKAQNAAKKIGPGMIDIDSFDQKLAEKLQKIAANAREGGQLETAKQAYEVLFQLLKDDKTKELLHSVQKEIKERGDPIKTKVASAMLAEVLYMHVIGKKDDAVAMAKTLSEKFGDTEMGHDAKQLLDNDFAPPNKQQIAAAEEKLRKSKKPATASSEATKSPSSSSSTSPKRDVAGLKAGNDVDTLTKNAEEEVKKMPKDELVKNFNEAYDKVQSLMKNAQPGAAGSQDVISAAMKEDIRGETIKTRIDEEKLSTPELDAKAQKLGTIRYFLMKSTILNEH